MIKIAEKNKGKKGFENIQVKEFLAFSEDHIVKILNQYIQENNQKNRERFCSDGGSERMTDVQRNMSLESLYGNSSHEGMESTKFV